MIQYLVSMHKTNSLKNKLKDGLEVIGTWSSLSSPNVINVLGTTTLDFVVIDMEHGSLSLETVQNFFDDAKNANFKIKK